MNLALLLLKASRRTVVFSMLLGAISGGASVGLIRIIHQTLAHRSPQVATIVLFAGLCVVVLLARHLTQVVLTRLSQRTISELTRHLCRRVLDAPLRQLEQIGPHRLLASLTGDVMVISQALNGLPAICVNLVVLLCAMAYLGYLAPVTVLTAILFLALSIASYRLTAQRARYYLRQGREELDTLLHHIRGMIEGIKELKVHHARREEFFHEMLSKADAAVRENHIKGFTLQAAAVSGGRMLFFVAIGLVLFVWPEVQQVDQATMAAYVLTILFLMAPLERIMAWLPLVGRARVALRKLEELGLSLSDSEPCLALSSTGLAPPHTIELIGVRHRYVSGNDREFTLGPIDLTLTPGELVFIVGGNGSGKTTLAKILTGLYAPESGELRHNGIPIGDKTREDYRQLFSVVFADVALFEGLLGLEGDDLEQRGRHYLARLELEPHVSLSEGRFSTTTELSKGQRKRLALVFAYLEDRPVYLFDEWAADQDPVFKRIFYEELLFELKERGKTVVAITHDDAYFHVADRVIHLRDGKMIIGGDPSASRQPADEGAAREYLLEGRNQ